MKWDGLFSEVIFGQIVMLLYVKIALPMAYLINIKYAMPCLLNKFFMYICCKYVKVFRLLFWDQNEISK